jgi:hypothetical protein
MQIDQSKKLKKNNFINPDDKKELEALERVLLFIRQKK